MLDPLVVPQRVLYPGYECFISPTVNVLVSTLWTRALVLLKLVRALLTFDLLTSLTSRGRPS